MIRNSIIARRERTVPSQKETFATQKGCGKREGEDDVGGL